MIHITLLPEKMRRVEGTPLPRQLTIYLGVAISAALIALNVLFAKNRIPEMDTKLKGLQNQVKEQSEKAKEVDVLEESVANIKSRVGAIEQLYRKRIVWAKLLSDLRDIVNKQNIDPANREYIWFTRLNFLPPKNTNTMVRRRGKQPTNVKKPPEEFLLLEGFASAPVNNRALEMVNQLLTSMQKYTPEKSHKEDVLQDLYKKEVLWDQRVAQLKKAGKSLSESEESYYKGLKDRIEHLATHNSGQIAKRSFSSFFSDEENYWQITSATWEPSAFGGKTKGSSGADAATQPNSAMRFSFKIGFKPRVEPEQASLKRGK